MKIFLAGHSGMVGSSILQKLKEKHKFNSEVVIYTTNRTNLNLLNQKQVNDYFINNKFDLVIDCAAKVGGILSNNTYRADFIYENLQIQNNLIHASYISEVKKFLFLGSSCIYPKFAEQPIKEEYLLASPLECTNEPYAIAKIAGIKMCESYYRQYGCNFISVMPTNLYGPNDNFNAMNSHVLPGLLHRFHLAKINDEFSVKIWGTGKAKREFMFIDDMAEACLFVLENLDAEGLYSQNISQINIGSGFEVTIKELAQKISETVGYRGLIDFDLSKPDGTMRKLLDCSRLKNMGYSAKTKLEDGLKETYNWYLNNQDKLKL
jgi:GDP-L-fucose synthase